jgi:hypothetical protein
MFDRRRTFLARCALQLEGKYGDKAADVESGRDGIPRSPPPFVAEVARIYKHASELSVTHLLSPSGGRNSALEKGRAEIVKDIDSQLVKIRTAVCLADFILRYLVHIPNSQKPASVNKGASFIVDGGYADVGFPVIRNRSDIIRAWSQAKSTIIFSLAAFYSEPVLLSNVLESADPADMLDQIWCDDLRRERFFGIARYCEGEIRGFIPNRRKEPLIDPSSMSVPEFDGMMECCPVLRTFSEEDHKKIDSYRAPV